MIDAQLPETVATVALREVDRLERMTPASPEYQMIRTYLDWVLDVPWDKTTEDRLDPVEARRVLDEDHYDLDKVKERIVEYLAVQKLRQSQGESRRTETPPAPPPVEPSTATFAAEGLQARAEPQPKVARMRGPILCFVGPPGVGKTSLGQSIARAMNRKFVRISLGGVRDEAEIRGHRRTYIGSMPGRLVQALKTAGSANPVLMLDEIDKITVGIQGDPGSGAARSARPGAEPRVPRSLHGDPDRSVAGAVHRDREPARHHSSGAARSHGAHLAERLHGGREGPHRAALSRAAAARGERAHRRPSCRSRTTRCGA